jgi:hypothetical protein
MDCRDCLHTPSGKCRAHRELKFDQTFQPGLVTEYKERLFKPGDTMEDIVARGTRQSGASNE